MRPSRSSGGGGGGVTDVTVTRNDALALRPTASVAVQFTIVSPIGNDAPDAGVQATVVAVSSVAVAVKFTIAPAGPVAGTVMFAGTVSSGGEVSAPAAK